MKETTFKAFRVESIDGSFRCSLQQVPMTTLETNELLVKVYWSSLNYKDALSASGNKGVTRVFPHTPGIDAVGVVQESTSSDWKPGDEVIVTSYDLGMNTDGGFAEYIKVPADWAVKKPSSLTMEETMIYGTAGFTAGMSVMKLAEQVGPDDGKIVVTGATGGVGAISVSILHKLGYHVVAVTGKPSEEAFLKKLGASEIMLRSDVENFDQRPLLKPLFAGGIDTVGGILLEQVIKTTQALGVVTCCGNVASPKLDLTVFPFILRGVSLVGIDSQNCPMVWRQKVWNALALDYKPEVLSETVTHIDFPEIQEKIDLILQGRLKGRTVLRVAK